MVVIDSGHTPKQPGALGARGIREVFYNEAFSDKLGTSLRAAGVQVVTTRKSIEDISLKDRAERANAVMPNLFLSIHHDSTQLKYLIKTEFNGLAAYQTIVPVAGYSIFISKLNPKFDKSYQFAQLLGKAMTQLDRPVALHHAERIEGENRELLDAELGIYRFDQLLVLRNTLSPAVLLEVGVIVDPSDEKVVSDRVKQDAIVQVTVAAVLAYKRQLAQAN